MAIDANSYGTVAGTAALVPMHSNGAGSFDDSTQPNLTAVESLIDQVSAVANGTLAQLGFTIPLTQADTVKMLAIFVNQEVASIVEGINGRGRFGPTAKTPGKGRFSIMLDDVRDYLEGIAYGLETMGATRAYSLAASIGYRETDESGDEVAPIFERKAFGNVFKEWDNA